jgi:hypothetical protein
VFEIVHTVTDFYDCPRAGIADFDGAAHLYEAEWDFGLDDYSGRYLLMPIDAETLALALEDWAIWRRWEDAFHRGLTDRDSHPALPGDGERHEELKRLLTGRLQADPRLSVRKLGEFRVRSDAAERPRGALRDLEVRWYDPA